MSRLTLLLAWRECDELLTWWWQDNRRSAIGSLLFLGKASFGCYQTLQTVYFLLPLPLLPCAGGQWIPRGFYFLSRTLDGLWRENREQAMRPKEPLTVKVFSPCGLIGDGYYLKVSLIRRVLAKKKKTSINVLRVLERRKSILLRSCINLSYVLWVAVVMAASTRKRL